MDQPTPQAWNPRRYADTTRFVTDPGVPVVELLAPGYVQEEFAAYLKCGRLEHGFLRVRCTACPAERLVAFGCKRRGFCAK